VSEPRYPDGQDVQVGDLCQISNDFISDYDERVVRRDAFGLVLYLFYYEGEADSGESDICARLLLEDGMTQCTYDPRWPPSRCTLIQRLPNRNLTSGARD
jgi:hypothetical protein